tara:strand:- start:5374 stop:6195 length:822 start_codon:yes stop_codon:yes gene_type:complete
MNNKDLLQQYADTGLEIPFYQLNKLSDNLKITYLRKRMLADDQTDDIELNRQDVLITPQSFMGVMGEHLIGKMSAFFEVNEELIASASDDYVFAFKYGETNPVLPYLLRVGDPDIRADNFIILFSKNERFIKNLNKLSINRILTRAADPQRVFSNLGSVVGDYITNKASKYEDIFTDVIYSSAPDKVIDIFGRENWFNHIKDMPVRLRVNNLSDSRQPKILLPFLGDGIIDFINSNLDGNLLHHIINNAGNPQEMIEILDENGIDHSKVDKYF